MASRPFMKLLPLAASILMVVFVLDLPRARSQDVKPAFEQFTVKFLPGFMSRIGQAVEIKFERTGRCWYKVEGREATKDVPARSGWIFNHFPAPEQIERLNKLLKDTQWLTAKGGAGPATHLHASTVILTLKRDGKDVSMECHGQRPEPYAALLHELHGLHVQEWPLYLFGMASNEWPDAWRHIAQELAALRGEPFAKSPYPIDYRRYLPTVRYIFSRHFESSDADLVPAVRLIGHLKEKSELKYLHWMAHDRSANLRQEVAWALLQCHASESLPFLVSMVTAGSRNHLELIQWGDEAVPHIVKLIGQSANHNLPEQETVNGENMIRAYLDNWKKVDKPVDPRVVAAVQQALDGADPRRSVRATYHREFLKQVQAAK